MEGIDNWRIVSILKLDQAAMLMVGLDPNEYQLTRSENPPFALFRDAFSGELLEVPIEKIRQFSVRPETLRIGGIG